MKEIERVKPMGRKERFKKYFQIKKPLYKNWWIYPLSILIFIVFVFGIPIAINEAYKAGSGYITVWGASEVLAFYAVILSGIISISALIITIYYSKKDTERQLKFYMGQSKAPFFVVDKVSQTGSKRRFCKNDNRQWIKEFSIPEPGKLEAGENGDIEITVKNIGDGMALAPSYQVDMFASTLIPDNVIAEEKNVVLTYDLQRNLDDKFVIWHFKDGFLKHNSGYVKHYTQIRFYYKNMLGIELCQIIQIEIIFDYEKQNMLLTVNEMSPQTGLV